MGMYIREGQASAATLALLRLGLQRCERLGLASEPGPIRFPVGVFFARGDREGEGKSVASQLVASFQYWNRESGDAFDFLYAGWSPLGDKLSFDLEQFVSFKAGFERASKWRYSGETDLLMLNFAVYPDEMRGHFEFEEAIVLPIETMLRKKMIDSVDGFAQQLFNYADMVAADHPAGPNRITALSDLMGFAAGRSALWDAFLSMALLKYKDQVVGLSHRTVKNLARKGGTLDVTLLNGTGVGGQALGA
ncbi:MAG: hypothetical protein V4864_15780 [Pseudomonadota bacterium]